MVLCFCYESPVFLNILLYEVKKRNEYVILGGGGGGVGIGSNLVPLKNQRHCFDINHRFASVICVSCQFKMRYSSVLNVTCPEVGRSSTPVERTSTDTYRTPTGCLTHENRTNHILTHKKRSSTEHIYPMASVRSLTCSKLANG